MSKNTSYGIKEVADVWFFPVGSKILFNTKGKDTQFSAVGLPSTNVTTYNSDNSALWETVKMLFSLGTSTTSYSCYYNIITSEEGLTTLPNIFKFDSLKVSNIEVASEETSAKGGKGNPELISWSYGKTITFTMTEALMDAHTLDLMFGASQEIDDTADNFTLTIDSNTFPDNYAIVGSTYMRSYANGQDEPFVFYIPKAKVNVGGTLTMEAEGDPTTFEMTIKALSVEVGKEKDVLIKFFKPNKRADVATKPGSLQIKETLDES